MHMFGLKKSAVVNASANEAERDPFEQLPVDIYVDAVALSWGGGVFGRIVVTSAQLPGEYRSYTEYHHNDVSVSINDIGSLTLTTSALNPSTEAAIASFVGTMPQQFSVSQIPSWTCGVYRPTAARARLYKATDPDDNTKLIGLLLEQNSSGQLVHVTWYKTQSASAVFSSPQASLSFHGVLDSNSSPSTDPSNIGGWTWYYA